MNPAEAVQLLRSLEKEVIAAANYALEKQVAVKSSQKSDTGISGLDIVTEADLEVQEMILQTLLKTPFSDATILAEEATASVALFTGKSPFTITLDPIDGTKHYADGEPNFSTMLSLLYAGEPIYTLVYYPTGGWLHRITEAGYESTPPPAWTNLDARDFSQSIITSYEEGPEFKNAWSDTPGELDAYELLFLGKAAGFATSKPTVYDGLPPYHLAKVLGWQIKKHVADQPIFDGKALQGYVVRA